MSVRAWRVTRPVRRTLKWAHQRASAHLGAGQRHPVRQGVTAVQNDTGETDGIIDWKALEAAAVDAMNNAYAPYSSFPVGAAAFTADGRIVSGCNVENASYGLTLCAECALGGKPADDRWRPAAGPSTALTAEGNVLMPCGRCRQLLYEFRAPGMELMTTQGIRTMDQVLPDAFGPEQLEGTP